MKVTHTLRVQYMYVQCVIFVVLYLICCVTGHMITNLRTEVYDIKLRVIYLTRESTHYYALIPLPFLFTSCSSYFALFGFTFLFHGSSKSL